VSAEQRRNRLSRFLAAEWRQLVRTVRSLLAFGLVVLAKLIFGAVGGGRGGHHDRRWRYLREFWEQEGREAFDRFIQRRQAPGQEKPEGPADTQG
jgi:hypothetical protein